MTKRCHTAISKGTLILGIFCELLVAGVCRNWAAEPDTPRRAWNHEPGYCRFPGTASPDGVYALAWAPSGLAAEARALLKEWPSDVEINSDMTGIENFLFDAARGRLLAPLPGFDYFEGQGWRKNRGELHVGWAPDSRSALAICGERWDDDGIAWIEPGANLVFDVKAILEKAFRSVLHQHEKKEKKPEDTMIQFNDPAVLTGGILVVDGHSGHMKEGPYFGYRLTFQVHSGTDGKPPEFELLKARRLDQEEPPETPDYEKTLNVYYGRLRARLDEKGRAALKKEEEEWLKLREGQPEEGQERLTVRRAAELRARAER